VPHQRVAVFDSNSDPQIRVGDRRHRREELVGKSDRISVCTIAGSALRLPITGLEWTTPASSLPCVMLRFPRRPAFR